MHSTRSLAEAAVVRSVLLRRPFSRWRPPKAPERLVDEKHEAEVADRSEFPTVVEDLLDEDLAQEILRLVRLQDPEVDDVRPLLEDGFRAEGRLLRVEDLRQGPCREGVESGDDRLYALRPPLQVLRVFLDEAQLVEELRDSDSLTKRPVALQEGLPQDPGLERSHS